MSTLTQPTTQTTTQTTYNEVPIKQDIILVEIPFTVNKDGSLTTTISMDQYNTLNKYLVSHQKKLDCIGKHMSKRLNCATYRPKIRYQFVVNPN